MFHYPAKFVELLEDFQVKLVLDLGFSIKSTRILPIYGIDFPSLASEDLLERHRAQRCVDIITVLLFDARIEARPHKVRPPGMPTHYEVELLYMHPLGSHICSLAAELIKSGYVRTK
jgi:hypothetical protein